MAHYSSRRSNSSIWSSSASCRDRAGRYNRPMKDQTLIKDPTLTTIAERSNYRETGRLEEVERLCAEFARAWPEAVRSFDFGRSAESKRVGRDRLAHDGAEYQSQSRLRESGCTGDARHAAPHRCVGSAGVRGPARHRWSGLRA